MTKNFAYRIPPGLAGRLRRGCRVVVPFGKRLVTGFVVGLGIAAAGMLTDNLYAIGGWKGELLSVNEAYQALFQIILP